MHAAGVPVQGWRHLRSEHLALHALDRAPDGRVLVGGGFRGASVVGTVGPDGQQLRSLGKGPAVTSLATDGSQSLACADGDPSRGTPARAWYGDDGQWSEYDLPRLDGALPVVLRPTAADEWLRVVGVYPVGDGWHLAVHDLSTGELIVDAPSLVLDADGRPGQVAAGSGEASVTVLGRLRPYDAPDRSGVSTWTLLMPDGGWLPGDHPVPLDRVTDTLSTYDGCWFAGPSGRTPVVLDQSGQSFRLPRVSLDPEYPVVCLGLLDPARGLDAVQAVALQSTTAAELWVREPAGAWAGQPLPGTRVHGICWSERWYVLVDGVLRIAADQDA